ncbi:H-2 class I histocompatibility antigen, Q9 alpha chain-like [Synchiropus splendidus]|uniref:H-2 class I histocompatibility antigen, Q9 alpha chain-like n=1 Tax=Synchiropus splendidus TaxID=270530 RepID=UPI00237E3287|nr:H-2 class I histocompatibility antigen, Q9 alpha chain-like [Synchiropus splendidus]
MGLFLLLALLGIDGANAGIHSLIYQATASSGVHHFPEYVEVGLVDDVVFSHYDSNSRRVEPKQDWMTRLTDDDPEYLERETRRCRDDQRSRKNLMREVQKRFNQTGGVHTLQVTHSCERDNETGEVRGHYQYAYDGQDFLSWDLKTLTWIAANQQAVDTKHQWDNDEGRNKYLQYYLKTHCPAHLKKLLDYGKSSIQRTELPSVSLLQKTPSSPIVCHATGFYPPRAKLFWTKDGEELHRGVTIEEVLPNPDGTYQMRAQLKLPDPSEDWERFTCVFHLEGVEEALLTKLDKEAILTNGKPEDQTVPIVVSVAAVLIIFTVIGLYYCSLASVGTDRSTRAGKRQRIDSNSSAIELLSDN